MAGAAVNIWKYNSLDHLVRKISMTHDAYTFNIFSFRRNVETSTYERYQFSRQRPLGQLIQTIMFRQAARPPESYWVDEWVLWVARPTRVSQQLQLLFESIEDRERKYFGLLYVEKRVFKRGCFMAKNPHSKIKLLFAVAVRVGGRSLSRRVPGATEGIAVQQQQS